MNLDTYRRVLNLQQGRFSHVDHDDAMVATVFKVTQPDGAVFILKICSRPEDYLREAHFLNHFAGRLPTPRIIQLVRPDTGLHGAILMECFPGRLIQLADLNDELMYQIGSLLARIHFDRVKGYGDLTLPNRLSSDPRAPFTMKFEEGMEECRGHLPDVLIDRCRRYYDRHVDLLAEADGPRIIHRDFRPGNFLIDAGKLQGIIDWSSARGGCAEEDFCPLELGEWSNDPSCRNSFLAGYASIRKVPPYEHIMPLMRLNRAIGAIGFTVKRGIWESKGARIYQFNRQFLEAL